MPIKPENRHRYPADWKLIRARILARAGNCCERCKAPNLVRIARGGGSDEGTYMVPEGEVFDAETGERLGMARMSDYCYARMTRIVLTIAHLDHTPENCFDDNLRAWCQRCHLQYDQQHHTETRQVSRRTAGGQLELLP